MFSVIIISAIILMTILIQYLKQKPFNKKSIKDHILIDLAFISGGFVVYFSSLILLRVVIGPFQNVLIADSMFMLMNYLYFALLTCILSFQLSQVLLIFHSAQMNSWREDWLITIHRIFVGTFSILSAELVCHFIGTPCHNSPLYHYVLSSNPVPEKPGQFNSQSGMVMIYVLAISICQISIEVKIFLIKRQEDRADELAVFAFRKLDEATKKVRIQPSSGMISFYSNFIEISNEKFLSIKLGLPLMVGKGISRL